MKLTKILLVIAVLSFSGCGLFESEREKSREGMIYIPGGEFIMGADGEEQNQGPAHLVRIEGFFIDSTEVTNADYRKFVEATGHLEPSYWKDGSLNGPNQPVVGVSWFDAKAYAEWSGKRLPTEAEWEKASRGNDGRKYPWGDMLEEYIHLNFDDNLGRPADVGSYPGGRSPYGILDMAGNVWEWVNDWYAADYYSKSPNRNPPGPESGEYKVIRGGSWYSNRYFVRCAFRDYADPDSKTNDLGFRCAADG
jgi:iron(II)-dependent oxidoreductase